MGVLDILSIRRTAKVFIVAIAAVTASGFVAPSFAAVDLSGYWDQANEEDFIDRGDGPDAGDYLGVPINDAARVRGDTWNAAYMEVPERQCIPHNAFYGWRTVGALPVRIWETPDLDALTTLKINTFMAWGGLREIWMDGRPHPPATAPHTWQGFSTGRWEGNVLVVHTTHLKSSHIRRNGLVFSDKAVLDERFFLHGDVLNHVHMLTDPVYLTEPLIRTNIFIRRAQPRFIPFPCRPAVEVPRAKGVIPHNAFRDITGSIDFARKYNLPLAAARGGAETALPEFMDSPAARAPAGTDRSDANN